MGDVGRAAEDGKREVTINRKFTSLLPDEYMRAKRIFAEKEGINAIPIVEDGRLIGDYTRWDDLLFFDNIILKKDESTQYWKKKKFVLVRPRRSVKRKQLVYDKFKRYLKEEEDLIESISPEEIEKYFEWADYFLFVDEDECRAYDTLWDYIKGKEFDKRKFKTYHVFLNENMMFDCLLYLQGHGIMALNLYFDNRTEYSDVLNKQIQDKYAKVGKDVSMKLYEEFYSSFFDDLYTEDYAKKIFSINYAVDDKEGLGKLKDTESPLYNVVDGERYTVGSLVTCNTRIFFFGPCFIYGHYVEDQYTIESFLQRHINAGGYLTSVINAGSPMYSTHIDIEMARIMNTKLRKNDIIIFYFDNRCIEGIANLDLMQTLEKNRLDVSWIVDVPKHCNHKVNSMYADAIYQELLPKLRADADRENRAWDKNRETVITNKDYIKTIYIDRYFSDFNPKAYKRIGSIVMNCNPFTRGHRYLIEEALKKVDFLIIFVVEEDKSLFSFNERFAFVSEGVQDLKNVMVVPSGSFILSQTTFPEYFIKVADEDIIRNVENDITIFAERIASVLNIKYRFVGEELDDPVTREYNEAMKRILPAYGVEVVEIPRKEIEGKVISATTVRRMLEEGKLEELDAFLPESTRRIMFTDRDNR